MISQNLKKLKSKQDPNLLGISAMGLQGLQISLDQASRYSFMTFHVNMNILVVSHCRNITVRALYNSTRNSKVGFHLFQALYSFQCCIWTLGRHLMGNSPRDGTTIRSEFETAINNSKVGLPQCEYYCGCFDTYHHCQTSFLRFDL